MKIVSNKEFEVLTSKCPARLKAMAKSRYKNDPTGQLTASDLDAYMEACLYSGDHKSVQWLKNLKHMAKSGMLRQLRQGAGTWDNHVLQINAMYKKGEIKFKLGDAVMCKESGKQGQVIDYLPDEKEFLVVLNPFQVKTYKAGDLEKVAKTAQLEDLGEVVLEGCSRNEIKDPALFLGEDPDLAQCFRAKWKNPDGSFDKNVLDFVWFPSARTGVVDHFGEPIVFQAEDIDAAVKHIENEIACP